MQLDDERPDVYELALDRTVDAVPLVVVLLRERFEQTLPDTLACLAVEPIEYVLQGPKSLARSSPRTHAERRLDVLPLPLIQLQPVSLACAPSLGTARAGPARATAYRTNGPDDSSRSVAHGHGHVYVSSFITSPRGGHGAVSPARPE